MTLDSSSIPFTDKLYIGGAWVDPIEGGFFTLISPETEREVWRVAKASNADVDRAVQAAREAFDTGPWGKTTPADRIALLEQFKSRLQARSADLSAAVQLQIGAPGGWRPSLRHLDFSRWRMCSRLDVRSSLKSAGGVAQRARLSLSVNPQGWWRRSPLGMRLS